jgi:hypothetical protein
MATDANTAKALRRSIKGVSRMLVNLHTAMGEVTREAAALSVDYKVVQGVYPVDTNADAVLAVFNQAITFLQTNAATITGAADLGDNIT